MSKRGITIIIVIILSALALATWGGTKIGDNSSQQEILPATKPGETTEDNEELTRIQTEYTLLQQNNDELNSLFESTKASLLEVQTQYDALKQSSESLGLEIAALEQDNAALQRKNASLEAENSNLASELTVIKNSLTSAQSDYYELQQANSQLQDKLNSKTVELSAWQDSYRDLTEENDDLEEEINTLESENYRLVQQYEALLDTKQFTVDNSLQVDLSAEMQSGGITWVRGEVTNISSHTISRIYVVVSRYNSSGTLQSMDLPPSVILNLSPGEKGYFSYFTSGEQCEITIYGDY
jgi:peptidoglycan hydrolase CwlO-like protein